MLPRIRKEIHDIRRHDFADAVHLGERFRARRAKRRKISVKGFCEHLRILYTDTRNAEAVDKAGQGHASRLLGRLDELCRGGLAEALHRSDIRLRTL